MYICRYNIILCIEYFDTYFTCFYCSWDRSSSYILSPFIQYIQVYLTHSSHRSVGGDVLDTCRYIFFIHRYSSYIFSNMHVPTYIHKWQASILSSLHHHIINVVSCMNRNKGVIGVSSFLAFAFYFLN